jgi:hypothetical protein
VDGRARRRTVDGRARRTVRQDARRNAARAARPALSGHDAWHGHRRPRSKRDERNNDAQVRVSLAYDRLSLRPLRGPQRRRLAPLRPGGRRCVRRAQHAVQRGAADPQTVGAARRALAAIYCALLLAHDLAERLARRCAV